MLPHLSKCVFAAPDVKARAVEELFVSLDEENTDEIPETPTIPALM